jgi:hypothetical protein
VLALTTGVVVVDALSGASSEAPLPLTSGLTAGHPTTRSLHTTLARAARLAMQLTSVCSGDVCLAVLFVAISGLTAGHPAMVSPYTTLVTTTHLGMQLTSMRMGCVSGGATRDPSAYGARCRRRMVHAHRQRRHPHCGRGGRLRLPPPLSATSSLAFLIDTVHACV